MNKTPATTGRVLMAIINYDINEFLDQIISEKAGHDINDEDRNKIRKQLLVIADELVRFKEMYLQQK